MKEYHKIETIFERDMEGNKKLIIGKFRNPAIEFLQNCKWEFTEKIDGTNIRVHWDGHKVTYGGRTDNAQLPGGVVEVLNDKFGGETNAQLFEQKFGATPVTLYGEGYGGKIQSGSDYSPTQNFIMFDVLIDNIWLQRDSVEDIAKAFGVDVVPVSFIGTINQAIELVKTKPLSTIGGKKEIEGYVGRPLVELFDRRGNRLIIKIKVDDYLI